MANSKTITSGELRERLAKLVKGPVLGAGDPGYEESRRVFNAMIERRPAAILKCSGAEDVAHGVTGALADLKAGRFDGAAVLVP